MIVIFLDIKWFAFKVTEGGWNIPEWLHYEPYVCYKCLGFWLLTALFLTCGLIFHLWITMGVGLLITALDTIALHLHIKNNTVTV